ncbi:hypothetical protein EBS02_04480 [bacterium]|jgi:hypothetical protein|nr:hypothetical protein [bacterium]
MNKHQFEDIADDEFEAYCQYMDETYQLLVENRIFFIADKSVSPSFKCERLEEMVDFFTLEEQYEKCAVLHKIRMAVEIEFLIQ